MSKPSFKHSNGGGRAPSTAQSMKAVRQATPPYEYEALKDAVLLHCREAGVRRAFDFGIYKGVSMGHAVRGHGLVFNAALLGTILDVTPFAYVKHLDLKRACVEAALQLPGLWNQSKPLERWASHIAERIFCLLNHLRRIKFSPVRWKQCARTMDKPGLEELAALVDKVQEATREYTQEEMVDAEPKLPLLDERPGLKSGEEGAQEQGQAVKSKGERSKGKGAQSKGSQGKEQSGAVEQKAGALCSGVRKTVLKQKQEEPHLYCVFGTAQSYIQKKAGSGRKLVIACSAKQHKCHAEVIKLICDYLSETGSDSKELAQRLRDHLLSV